MYLPVGDVTDFILIVIQPTACAARSTVTRWGQAGGQVKQADDLRDRIGDALFGAASFGQAEQLSQAGCVGRREGGCIHNQHPLADGELAD